MRIASVVGARPNFVKLAPIHKVLSNFSDHVIVHTGQHYDYRMSAVFFKEFGLPKPDFDLGVGSGSPCYQIGEMLKKLEELFLMHHFDLVIVYGDTNSTFAGALAGVKAKVKLAHVESGLRSFDRSMPEEINRILTDELSDYLFAPTQTAVENLKRENVNGRVVYTGDISVEILRDATRYGSQSNILNELKLIPKSYVLLTMHRTENTEVLQNLVSIIHSLENLSDVKVVFPIHPRTVKVLNEKGLFSRLKNCSNVHIIDPLGYIDFIKLVQNATKVITDSGGVQKETFLLGVPCITIRQNTEWVETIEEGWNILTGTDTNRIVDAVRNWMPPSSSSGRYNQEIFGGGQTSTIIRNEIASLVDVHRRSN
jgi:UDP-N-acetylglucosamine 2-epimerase